MQTGLTLSIACQQAFEEGVRGTYLTITLPCEFETSDINAATSPATRISNQKPKISGDNVWMKRCAVDPDSRHELDDDHRKNVNTTRTTKEPGTGKHFNRLLPCAFLWKSISTSSGEKSFGNSHGKCASCTCICSMRNILEILSIKQNDLRAVVEEEWTEREVKENLQTENLE